MGVICGSDTWGSYVGVLRWSDMWEGYMGVIHWSATWECYVGVIHGIDMWECYVGVIHGSDMWECYVGVIHGSDMWECYVGVIRWSAKLRRSVHHFGLMSKHTRLCFFPLHINKCRTPLRHFTQRGPIGVNCIPSSCEGVGINNVMRGTGLENMRCLWIL